MKLKDLRHTITWPISYCVLIGIKALASMISFKRLGTLATLFSRILLIPPGNKKLIMANLDIVFSDKTVEEREILCRQSARNIILTFMEFLWIRGNPKKLLDVVRLSPESEALLKTYYEKDQGVMLISPHLGNWELGNLVINAKGYHGWAVAKEQNNPFTEQLINEGRKLSGAGIIYEKGAAKRMMRLLKNNEFVMLLIDQNTPPKQGGVFVEFFGLPVTVSRAPLSFARKCNAEILMARSIRQKDGTLEVRLQALEKPIADYPDDQSLCREIMKVHETFILDNPDQYLWLYKRFRYIPSNWTGDRSVFPYYHREIDGDYHPGDS